MSRPVFIELRVELLAKTITRDFTIERIQWLAWKDRGERKHPCGDEGLEAPNLEATMVVTIEEVTKEGAFATGHQCFNWDPIGAHRRNKRRAQNFCLLFRRLQRTALDGPSDAGQTLLHTGQSCRYLDLIVTIEVHDKTLRSIRPKRTITCSQPACVLNTSSGAFPSKPYAGVINHSAAPRGEPRALTARVITWGWACATFRKYFFRRAMSRLSAPRTRRRTVSPREPLIFMAYSERQTPGSWGPFVPWE